MGGGSGILPMSGGMVSLSQVVSMINLSSKCLCLKPGFPPVAGKRSPYCKLWSLSPLSPHRYLQSPVIEGLPDFTALKYALLLLPIYKTRHPHLPEARCETSHAVRLQHRVCRGQQQSRELYREHLEKRASIRLQRPSGRPRYHPHRKS